MVQMVSHRPLTSDARVRARVSPCGICGRQSGSRTWFSPRSSVFHCQYHSAVTTYSYITCWIKNRPVVGRSSETQSLPIDMNNNVDITWTKQARKDTPKPGKYVSGRLVCLWTVFRTRTLKNTKENVSRLVLTVLGVARVREYVTMHTYTERLFIIVIFGMYS
jgi:hypothetical protein